MNESDFDLSVPADFRSGYVAVVGRPNVGKSSLMNAWLGQKIAIVSSKPQTTRHRLLGILTNERAQIIFVDTPGIHKPLHRLGEMMVAAAGRSITDADVVLFVVDVSEPPTSEDRLVAETIARAGHDQPVIIALNKIDRCQGDCSNTDAYLALVPHVAYRLISATRGDNRDDLLQVLIDHLPPGPPLYPPDQVTDQPERFIVAEMVREAALNHLHQEVPHALAVVTTEFKERPGDMVYIGATLYVERESQKRIVVGQGGRTLKAIGQAARSEIEALLGRRVYLDLWVKVWPNWRRRDDDLRRLGFRPL
jgi:GTP-binding protein Era